MATIRPSSIVKLITEATPRSIASTPGMPLTSTIAHLAGASWTARVIARATRSAPTIGLRAAVTMAAAVGGEDGVGVQQREQALDVALERGLAEGAR